MILINIDIPVNCFDCPCYDDNNGVCNLEFSMKLPYALEPKEDGRPEGCPLMEVKVVRKKAENEKE